MADFISAQIILRGSVFLPTLSTRYRIVSPPLHLPIRGFGVINAAGWGGDEESESGPVTSSASSVYQSIDVSRSNRTNVGMGNVATRFLMKLIYGIVSYTEIIIYIYRLEELETLDFLGVTRRNWVGEVTSPFEGRGQRNEGG